MKQRIFLLAICAMLLLLCSSACADIVEERQHDDHEEEEAAAGNAEHNVQVSENRLAAQLFAVLEHYKQADPVGFPGAPIPDPFLVPDMKKSLGVGNLNMQQVKAHGISKFRIVSIKADLKEMKVEAGVMLDEMVVRGQYTLSSFLTKANGPFVVALKKVAVRGTATLSVLRDGQLTTDRIKMDITFKDMSMDFQNLGIFGSVFQGLVNSAPTLVFDAMKPFMLQEIDKQLRAEINANIVKLMGDRRLPNSCAPLDMALAEARKRVRRLGYDPYRLPNYNRTVGIFSMQLANTWIAGISSFYRVGEMLVAMENNTMALRFQVGTQQISGAGQWEIGCGLVSRVGHMQFTVQYLRVTVAVSQSLDTRKRPQINDLQLDLGNIQVRCDGAGTLDYVMEFAVNLLPNLLRYQIMDALENPLKMRVQEKFNAIDVERAIKENFHKFEALGSDAGAFDFKL